MAYIQVVAFLPSVETCPMPRLSLLMSALLLASPALAAAAPAERPEVTAA
ncbi:amidohydrolase, partial [Stenotrophomonas sp. 278]